MKPWPATGATKNIGKRIESKACIAAVAGRQNKK